MANKSIILVFLFVLSCKGTYKQEENKAEIKTITIPQKKPEILYGINLDSFSVITKKIRWGQSFSDILLKNGISNQTIYQANQKIKPFFNLKKIKKGNTYTLLFKKGNKKPSYFIYETSVYDYLICKLTGPITANKIQREITYNDKKISGSIQSSLYLSFDEQNHPLDLVNHMVDVFAWQVDFFRIMPGDRYDILYTEERINGKLVGIKNIKAAKFFHNNKTYYAIGYDQGFGNDYFDEEGRSLRKTFLRSPLNFYRISSKYQKRRFHPILKRYRDHLGTDYAAPRGTPIMSVADGKVVEARYTKNNGYFVKIKHNNIYTTQYLHMSKFAKGIKKGRFVDQGEVIGYVGSTGLATGPHVCFRFWRNGRQVDPYKQNDLPDGEPVLEKHVRSFSYVKEKYIKILQEV